MTLEDVSGYIIDQFCISLRLLLFFYHRACSTTKCMSSAWNLHEDKFVKLGLPRNDVFFSAQKMNELSNCIRDRFNIKTI